MGSAIKYFQKQDINHCRRVSPLYFAPDFSIRHKFAGPIAASVPKSESISKNVDCVSVPPTVYSKLGIDPTKSQDSKVDIEACQSILLLHFASAE